MDSPSISLIRQFTDENAGLMVAYFLVNIISLFLETIVISILFSKIFSAFDKNAVHNVDSVEAVKKYMILFMVVYIVVKFFQFIKTVIYDEISPKFFYFLRTTLFDRIVDRYQIDYKEINTGYILFNFDRLPTAFKRLMTELLTEYVPSVLALIVCICYLAYMNKFIGIAILVAIAIFIIVVVLTMSTSVELSSNEHTSFKNDNGYIHDRMNNLFDIYTSGTESMEKAEFADMEKNLVGKINEIHWYITMVTSILEIVAICIFASGFYVLYRSYKGGVGATGMSNENIISTILVLSYFLTYFSKISGNYIGLTDVFGYSRESDRFLKEINGIIPIPTQIPTEPPLQAFQNLAHGPVEFKGVNFKYPESGEGSEKGKEGKNVLNDVNLYIKPGTKIAIYGKSGSGKSTLIKLLMGFYTPSGGKITINGKNIKEMPIDELRRKVAVVNQNVKLFDKSIFDNMIYGNKYDDVTEEDIKKILGNVGVFEKIPEGLSANVGVSGSKLSGGQKQIINLVRAILKDSPILILDEPTSALDAGTKKIVMNLVKKLKDKIVIIITHDKDMVSHVDKVYELVGGKLNMIG